MGGRIRFMKNRKHKIIDEVAVEYGLSPQQVKMLKQVIEFDNKSIYVMMARSNGRTMLKKAYYEMMDRIAEEELK